MARPASDRTAAHATRPPAARAQMADVARLAGVSTATVSRALRRADIVSPQLRERVRQAVETLGYVPNPAAGGLAAARTRTVGVVVPSLVNSFFAATLDAMAERLAPRGYQIMLGNSAYSQDAESSLVNSLLSWSPAAIVLTGQAHSRATLQRLLGAGIPVVEMWELGENPLDSLVGFSHRAVGRLAARHLLDRGRKRIAFVGAALDEDRRAAQRAAGFGEVMRESLRVEPIVLSLPQRASAATGGLALAELLARHPDVDGVALSNDAMALGSLFECQRRGLAVPRDLALVGFGDLDFAAWSTPSLSTIRPPRREIGLAVANHLLQRFDEPSCGPTTIDVGFELVPRAST